MLCLLGDLQSFRHIKLTVHIDTSVLPGTHLHLNHVKHVRVKVPCPMTYHQSNVPTLRGDEHMIFFLHQVWFETARRATTMAKRHALTVVPHLSLINNKTRDVHTIQQNKIMICWVVR